MADLTPARIIHRGYVADTPCTICGNQIAYHIYVYDMLTVSTNATASIREQLSVCLNCYDVRNETFINLIKFYASIPGDDITFEEYLRNILG